MIRRHSVGRAGGGTDREAECNKRERFGQGWGMYEGNGEDERIAEEYRTSWLSYSVISQLVDLWRAAMEDFDKLKTVDIRTVERNELIDIMELSEEETDSDRNRRMKEFMEKVKNPYCFMVGDVIVKSSFLDGVSLKQRLQELADGI